MVCIIRWNNIKVGTFTLNKLVYSLSAENDIWGKLNLKFTSYFHDCEEVDIPNYDLIKNYLRWYISVDLVDKSVGLFLLIFVEIIFNMTAMKSQIFD